MSEPRGIPLNCVDANGETICINDKIESSDGSVNGVVMSGTDSNLNIQIGQNELVQVKPSEVKIQKAMEAQVTKKSKFESVESFIKNNDIKRLNESIDKSKNYDFLERGRLKRIVESLKNGDGKYQFNDQYVNKFQSVFENEIKEDELNTQKFVNNADELINALFSTPQKDISYENVTPEVIDSFNRQYAELKSAYPDFDYGDPNTWGLYNSEAYDMFNLMRSEFITSVVHQVEYEPVQEGYKTNGGQPIEIYGIDKDGFYVVNRAGSIEKHDTVSLHENFIVPYENIKFSVSKIPQKLYESNDKTKNLVPLYEAEGTIYYRDSKNVVRTCNEQHDTDIMSAMLKIFKEANDQIATALKKKVNESKSFDQILSMLTKGSKDDENLQSETYKSINDFVADKNNDSKKKRKLIDDYFAKYFMAGDAGASTDSDEKIIKFWIDSDAADKADINENDDFASKKFASFKAEPVEEEAKFGSMITVKDDLVQMDGKLVAMDAKHVLIEADNDPFGGVPKKSAEELELYWSKHFKKEDYSKDFKFDPNKWYFQFGKSHIISESSTITADALNQLKEIIYDKLDNGSIRHLYKYLFKKTVQADQAVRDEIYKHFQEDPNAEKDRKHLFGMWLGEEKETEITQDELYKYFDSEAIATIAFSNAPMMIRTDKNGNPATIIRTETGKFKMVAED
jgi:hypothetical protein